MIWNILPPPRFAEVFLTVVLPVVLAVFLVWFARRPVGGVEGTKPRPPNLAIIGHTGVTFGWNMF